MATNPQTEQQPSGPKPAPWLTCLVFGLFWIILLWGFVSFFLWPPID